MKRLEILYEDNHLLVVNKPAGLATMGTSGAPSLHALACDYLRHKYHKPAGVYVGVVSRLDTVTSGVIVLARTSKAAARLSAQFANHSGDGAAKVYLAIVEGALEEPAGELKHFVRKDDAAHRMRVVEERAADAKPAVLRFVALQQTARETLLAVRLLTGRKHQVRLQFAAIGHPLLGDVKYGSHRRFGPAQAGVPGVALHSWRLQINHPTRQQPIAFGAPPPRHWNPFFPDVGGLASSDAAVAEALQLPHFVPLQHRMPRE